MRNIAYILFFLLLYPLLLDDYVSMSAQRMADESINYAPYECEDEWGVYPSSYPCDDMPCVAKCLQCHVQLDCDEMAYHDCGEKVECSFCHQKFTPSEWAVHDAPNCISDNPNGVNPGGGGNGDGGNGGSGVGGSSSGGGIGGSYGNGSSSGVSSGSSESLFSTSLSVRQNRARQLLDKFCKSHPAGVFPGFSAADVYRDMQTLLGNASLVKQGGNGTCGAAALCKYLLANFPDKFMEMVISLYQYGTYEDWNLSVTDAMKQGTAQHLDHRDLSFVDALVQGAMTNSNNGSMDYNPFEDNQYRGTASKITLEDLIMMKVNGEDVRNVIEEFRDGISSFMWPGYITDFFKTRLGMNVEEMYLPEYRDLYKIDCHHNFVFALVCSDTQTDNFTGWYPSHYVQITGVDVNGHIIDYWSWGQNGHKSYNEKGTGIVKIYVVKQYEQNCNMDN